MYDDIEKRKRKILQMKEEIARLYKKVKKIVFNVFNISNKSDFEKKMNEDFAYLEYSVVEEDKEEDCLVIEVDSTMAEDFLNIEGCQINNHNIAIFLDEKLKNTEIKKKVGTWDEPSGGGNKGAKQSKNKPVNKGKKRGRLQ